MKLEINSIHQSLHCNLINPPPPPQDEPVMSLLRTMSPAAIDAEIRGLSPDNGGSLEWLQRFMQFLLRQLKINMSFELVCGVVLGTFPKGVF